MLLHKGDIVLANFPFTDLSQTKLRPAIVLYVSQPRDETTCNQLYGLPQKFF
jgi:mRNA interferase MazF